MKNIILWSVFKIWILIGSKILGFRWLNVYSLDKENVTAVTFSQDEEHVNKIMKVE